MNKRIDKTWDFKNADTKYCTHSLHSYPAMMIPQVASKLLFAYGQDKLNILDPFMGSGTTLVETKINKFTNFYNAYGIDINPLSRLMTKVKTTSIPTMDLIDEFKEIAKRCEYIKDDDIEYPSVYNMDYWFKENVKKDLAKIKMAIDETKNQDYKDFFNLAFSSIIRDVSNTRNSEFKLYRMPPEKLETFNPDVYKIFFEKTSQNISKLAEFDLKANNCDVHILNEDSRTKTSIPEDAVDLIVTSPPYGDSRTTVAYGQFSRLSLEWLGYDRKDASSVDKISLGGKKLKSLKSEALESSLLNDTIELIEKEDEKRANDVLSFFTDFYQCIKEFDRVTRDDYSNLCFVVGNRIVKNILIPMDEILVELFKLQNDNFIHVETIIREIPNKKMPKKNSPTNIKGEKVSTMNNEYIVILEK